MENERDALAKRVEEAESTARCRVADLKALRGELSDFDRALGLGDRAMTSDRITAVETLAKRVEELEAMVAAVGAGNMTEPLWNACVEIAERRAGRAKA